MISKDELYKQYNMVYIDPESDMSGKVVVHDFKSEVEMDNERIRL